MLAIRRQLTIRSQHSVTEARLSDSEAGISLGERSQDLHPLTTISVVIFEKLLLAGAEPTRLASLEKLTTRQGPSVRVEVRLTVVFQGQEPTMPKTSLVNVVQKLTL